MKFLTLSTHVPFIVMNVLSLMGDKYVNLDHAREIESITELNVFVRKEPMKTMNQKYVLSVKYLKNIY